jgi:hypothetical protein
MSNKLRRVIHYILDILFGIEQPPRFFKIATIVANSDVVLGMSDSTTLPSTHFYSPVNEFERDDALILGNKTDENSCLMQVNEAEKLALLETSIIPQYYQLRFLDGRFIIGVQIIGYVTSFVHRTIHHCQ